MRVGRTSFVVFVSTFAAAVLGFLATVYFARELGAAVYGYYAAILALYNWLVISGELGIASAVTKRMSEGDEPSAYFVAGACLVAGLGALVTVGLFATRDLVDDYIGVEATGFVLVLVLVGLCYTLVTAGLNGKRKVHISGVLEPVKEGVRSITQIGLVFVGFGLTGMVAGYAVGGLVVGLVGLAFLSVELRRPRRRHVRSLFDFAKFSWLGRVRSRTFQDVDILILTALVPTTLVGIYAIAWSIANFLTLFGNAIVATLFPELSRAEANGDRQLVSTLVNDSLTYGGLLIIPGLFGGVILGEYLLGIYGEEFTEGTTVLGILILATLVYGYYRQLQNALNAIDRPDVAFRINVIFVVTNVTLNVVLIYELGWTGAAIATALSTGLGLVLSYRSLGTLVDFAVPVGQIARQFGAALIMTAVVLGSLELLERSSASMPDAAILATFTALGAVTYFVTLCAISREFRDTIAANAPALISFRS